MEEPTPNRTPETKSLLDRISQIATAVVGIVAGVALVGAVISIVSQSLRQPEDQAAAPSPPTAVPVTKTNVPKTPVNRPALPKREPIAVNVATKGGLPSGYEKVVAVTLDPKTFERQAVRSVFLRELVCQAVLIAAEDELGLATLDPAIGEVIPESEEMAGPVTVKGMAMHWGRHGKDGKQVDTLEYTISLSRPVGARVIRSDVNLILPPQEWTDAVIEQIEGLSRGKFVDFLLKAGFQKNEAKSDEVVPALNGLQNRLDFIAQFAWIQHLRARIRVEGDSPETLSGLIRAYANLGNLTDFHWNAASKAFKARSIIYAQRMIAKYGESSMTLAHRAYANALSGRHAAAMTVIETARTAKGDPAPAWLGLIDAYASYRPKELAGVTGDDQELSLYLQTRMLDLAVNPAPALVEISNFLELNPACCRASELAAEIPRLGSARVVTEGVFDAQWPDVYGRLTEVPNLPASAKEIAVVESVRGNKPPEAEYERRMEMISALSAATSIKETQGPSWAVLADMLREVTFTQVWRMLDVQGRYLAVDCDPVLQRTRPLIQGHRFEKVLDSYGSQYDTDFVKDYHKWLNSRYTSVSALPIHEHIKKIFGENLGVGVGSTILESGDDFYEDLARRLAWKHGLSSSRMYVVSPLWPAAVADTIAHNWRLAATHAAEWEETYADSTPIMMAFGRRYQMERRRADAIRCLEKVNKTTPTFAAYLALATLHDELGELDKWQSSLEAAVQLPNLGLERAQAEAALADGFMKRGEWKLAEPHAQASASSGSAWGMQKAARVSEGLEDWKTAERYVSAISRRYVTSIDSWYFWCIRSGRGDLDAAKDLAESYWQGAGANAQGNTKYHIAMGQLFEDKTPDAVSTLKEFYLKGQRNHEEYATLAAVLADSIGDVNTRDELFTEMFVKWEQYKPYHELVNMFRGVISGDDNKRWDPLAFEVVVLNTDASTVPWLYMLAGIFLAHHQSPELSQEYLQTAATGFDVSRTACVIVSHLLRKQNVTIGKTRLNDLPDALAPFAELLRKSQIARDDRKFDEADAILMKALEQRPDFVQAALILAKSHADQGRFADAIQQYEKLLQVDPNLSAACNRLSLIYSTCSDDAIRNGKKAMEYAERGNSVRANQDAETLNALAAANAELGNFDKAVELQTLACTMELYRSVNQLTAYKDKKPFRQPLPERSQ